MGNMLGSEPSVLKSIVKWRILDFLRTETFVLPIALATGILLPVCLPSGFIVSSAFAQQADADASTNPNAYLPRPPRGLGSSSNGLRGSRGYNTTSRRASDVPPGSEVFGGDIEPLGRPGDTVRDDNGMPMALTAEGEMTSPDDLVLDDQGNDQFGIRRTPLGLSDDEQGAAQRAQPASQVLDDVGSTNGLLNGSATTRANTRKQPDQAGIARPLAEDPFAPIGVRRGSFDIYTRLTQTLGYTNNAGDYAGSSGGMESETSGQVQMKSDWSIHQLDIEANGNWDKTFGDDGDDFPTAGILGNLRLDLADSHSLDLKANYNYSTEGASSNDLPGNVDGQTGIHQVDFGAEFARTNHKLNYELEATAGSLNYENADLVGGGTLDQGDRDYSYYGLRGRLSYQASAIHSPFIEGIVGWKEHDQQFDRNGQERDSTTYALKGGISFDHGEKWRGEIAIGYESTTYDDGNLKDLDGLVFDANLMWSPERDTVITFTASTALDDSTSNNVSGALVHSGGVNIERIINDRLSSNLSLGVSVTDYDGGGSNETDYTAAWGVDYWVNRHFALTGDISYENQDSSDDQSYDKTTVKAGVIWQN